MTQYIQIVLTNNSPQTQNFFFFQQPATYTGGSEVYSNSIQNITLAPSTQTGGSYTFLAAVQYYAGVQQAYSMPTPGQTSGYNTATRAIDLAPAAGGSSTNDATTMSLTPSLGLSVPTPMTGVAPGAFRIVAPSFDPTLNKYLGGSAVTNANGITTLSNFVLVQPLQNLDCQPILKFYVQTGSYTAGTVMNFITSSVNAATCDATTGFRTFNVSYNADGTWTVTQFAAATAMISTTSALALSTNVSATVNNVNIQNEAGTAIICTGYAANLNNPATVTNLSNPNALVVHGTYQLNINNGAYVGYDCIQLAGTTGTFTQ
jgi:hypothetical protein